MSISPRGKKLLHHILASNDALSAGSFKSIMKSVGKVAKKATSTAVNYAKSPVGQALLQQGAEMALASATGAGRKRKPKGGSISAGSFKSIMKSVGKVAKQATSTAVNYAKSPEGQALLQQGAQMALASATGAGRKKKAPHLVKGSPEAKLHMAKLRAMRK